MTDIWDELKKIDCEKCAVHDECDHDNLCAEWITKAKPELLKNKEKAKAYEKLEASVPLILHLTFEQMVNEYKMLQDKLEDIKNYLKEEKMVVYDSYNRYSAQIITHTKGMLLLAKILEILEVEE